MRILVSDYASLLLLTCLLTCARHFKRTFNLLINVYIIWLKSIYSTSLWIWICFWRDWFWFSFYEIYTLHVFLYGCVFLCRFIIVVRMCLIHTSHVIYFHIVDALVPISNTRLWLFCLLMLACVNIFGFVIALLS